MHETEMNAVSESESLLSREALRPRRNSRIVSVAIAVVGTLLLGYSFKFFLFHPMTTTDEYIGTRLWVVGSWLLGGGLTLTFARPWIAVIVGFVSPALTFVLAIGLYLAAALLAPFLG